MSSLVHLHSQSPPVAHRDIKVNPAAAPRSFGSTTHASFRSAYGRSAAWLISSHSTATHSPMAARLPPSPANTRYRPHTVVRSRCISSRAQFPAFVVVIDFPCTFHLTPICSSSTSSPPALSSTPANARPVRTFCGACPVCATSNSRPQAGRFSFPRPIYVCDSQFQDSAAANAVWDRLMLPLAVAATLQPRAHRGAVKLDK